MDLYTLWSIVVFVVAGLLVVGYTLLQYFKGSVILRLPRTVYAEGEAVAGQFTLKAGARSAPITCPWP